MNFLKDGMPHLQQTIRFWCWSRWQCRSRTSSEHKFYHREPREIVRILLNSYLA